MKYYSYRNPYGCVTLGLVSPWLAVVSYAVPFPRWSKMLCHGGYTVFKLDCIEQYTCPILLIWSQTLVSVERSLCFGSDMLLIIDSLHDGM